MNKAFIFDIQRNSFVDGPGIRTTVFFKGCNLKCAWCHNPEGQDFEPQMMFYKDKCTGCGKCKQVCPFNLEKCDLCGKCTLYCPVDARKVCGKEYTVDEVFSEIIKDKAYYDNSDGGVTFSGGECMLQIDFLVEILKKCRENGIHTVVDTAGHIPYENFKKILPYTDLFLYDIKIFDTQKHKKYIGVGNELIFENLKKLFWSGAKIWIRIPIIPNVNDSLEEMQKINDFLKTIGTSEKIELLPYHAMGEYKYRAICKEPEIFGALPKRQKVWGDMQILSRKRCVIGEGPVWNPFDSRLYHMNPYEKEICIIDIAAKETVVRKLDFSVAAIGLGKKGELLISCKDGAFILNANGTRSPLYDRSKYDIKYGNDAKVGPDGRFYIGTQSSKRMGVSDILDGKLYCIDANGEVKILLDGLILSNGFDWSMDEKRFYHTDSDTNVIREYAYDKNGPKLNFTGRQITVPGVDGFTIDHNDFLYATSWGKGHIAVVDTKTMQIIKHIEVPARIPASCCFAGEAMDQLVVVTASWKADLQEDPYAGSTFIQRIDTQGRKPFLFG